MVAKVTQYLQEVLAPTLDHFRVPATYASQIIDMVELQMISFLRHWDDLAFRRTLLLLGSEEGPFYEPAGKADVKCFIVVTLRNSPIETIQSDNYACAGMQDSLSSQDVKEITSGAIRFFNPLDFSSMCLQAKNCSGYDYYQEIVERHPAAWAALRALGTTSAKIIDYPKVQYDTPFSIEACDEIQTDCAGELQQKRLIPKVVFDGYKMHPTEKNKIIIDEEVAPIVRRIFAMALDGVSCRQIAATLNEEGVPTPATYCGWNMGRKGPYAGLWSSERISDMLQNETYIGNMVQGRQVKISYKSKKCLHQDRNNWVVVEDTHEPLIDAESFRKVRMLVNSRKRTRSRTYDFLLKGLIFCHECGYPLGVLNRPNAKGEETLYFVCRTYQRFTKNSACTTHYIKEKTVTDAVIAKVREVCEDYLTAEALLPAAEKAVKEASQESKTAAEISALQNKSANLTEHLDRMYTDRLSGLLPEEDFQRIFTRIKDERAQLEERIKELQQQQKNPISQTERAKDLVQRYLDTACANRELLVSLIERIELTAAREIIVKFRFAELQQTG